MPYVNTTPPRSQYNRNITFRLTGGGPAVVYTLPIKPGELDLQTPARVTTTQTLQGVYQDLGGIGVRTIRLQGNTGWRRRYNGADNNGLDGFENFRMLYNGIYVEYHRRISGRLNANDIQLLLIDDLYDATYAVSIDDFQASKSVSKTLLYAYTITMTVQDTNANGRVIHDLEELPSVALDRQYVPIALREVLNAAAQYGSTSYRLYTVQKGDNLQSISFAYFGTVNRAMEIAKLNSIAPPYAFNPGKILNIPW